MKGKIEIESSKSETATARLGGQSLDRLPRTGYGHRLGGIDRADLERATQLIDQLASASAAMRPSPRVRSWLRLRATTTRAASASDRAPPAQAAAISPTLWPM